MDRNKKQNKINKLEGHLLLSLSYQLVTYGLLNTLECQQMTRNVRIKIN